MSTASDALIYCLSCRLLGPARSVGELALHPAARAERVLEDGAGCNFLAFLPANGMGFSVGAGPWSCNQGGFPPVSSHCPTAPRRIS